MYQFDYAYRVAMLRLRGLIRATIALNEAHYFVMEV